MAPRPATSVVVLSRDRPEGLLRTLASLRFQDHPAFEVIAVTDPAGRAALEAAGWLDRIKHVPFDTPNVSAARNRGVAVAAGEIVAFIDDDAAAEPTWLGHLTEPFAETRVAATGGFVRGRNGISFQWRARSVDRYGRHAPLAVDPVRPSVHTGDGDRAIRTEGTNCAFRRDVLQRLGGFDECFRFYLDETDLNLRLARAGWSTAIVPLAQVHHGFAASALRRADRVPTNLRETGASLAWFCRKHGAPEGLPAALAAFRAEQRRRLLRHMVAGRLEPRDIGRLLRTLEAGFVEGTERAGPEPAPLAAPAPPLQPFASAGAARRDSLLIGALPWHWARARAHAAATAAEGAVVTLLALEASPRRHRVSFEPQGFWLHRGGLFGPDDRDGPLLRFATLRGRMQAEVARLAGVRPAASVLTARSLGEPFPAPAGRSEPSNEKRR